MTDNLTPAARRSLEAHAAEVARGVPADTARDHGAIDRIDVPDGCPCDFRCGTLRLDKRTVEVRPCRVCGRALVTWFGCPHCPPCERSTP